MSPIQNRFSSPFFIYMSSIIEQIASQQVWEEYLARSLTKGRFYWDEFEAMDEFVEQEEYISIVRHISEGGKFSIPQKRAINKSGSNKKRIVYTYRNDEMSVLKVIAHLLYKYDDCFAPNCYAFRRGIRVTDAMRRVFRAVQNRNLWAYKLDIQNYFNSISIPILLPQLKQIFADDIALYNLFEAILSDNRAEYNGEIIEEQHGAMAGIPIASFLANVYLNEVDHYFSEHGIIYARYSDDIIIFAEDYDTLMQHKSVILGFLKEYKLNVNPSKERIYTPDEPYEFLGFKCHGKSIDISKVGIEKMKGKIRRKTRSILRWKQRKGVSSEKAMARLIGRFNRVFFEQSSIEQSLTWSRWYFPIINSTQGLQEIDHFLQQKIRVVAAERHNKSMYNITYDTLKRLGYRSLVNEFYKHRREVFAEIDNKKKEQ